mmetsp:Transcript_25371/g.63622  ORF Transcript_25371/g.63622 Transcript_25371/m.63622 type:complete len:465 (+) Transcript_25371:81-1475(+)
MSLKRKLANDEVITELKNMRKRIPASQIVRDASQSEAESQQAHSSSVSSPPLRGAFLPRPSLLSSEAFQHVDNGYRGFVNLGLLLMILNNFRLVIANLYKYGLLFKPSGVIFEWYRWPATLICLSFNVFIVGTVLVEKRVSQGRLSEKAALLWQRAILLTLLVVPNACVSYFQPALGWAISSVLLNTVILMKLISYMDVNQVARQNRKKPSHSHPATASDTSPVVYPNNVTLKDMYRFLLFPTLCYKLNYPRSPEIRWGFLCRRCIEMVFLTVLVIIMVVQYIIPIVEKTPAAIQNRDVLFLLERVLKLAGPNLYVWLIGFYVFFHLYLNVIAELTGFADRQFYLDWWNSPSLGYYWRTWNLPVHQWLVQHVYIPARRRGYSKSTCYLLVFFVSAVFHELILAVPFRSVKFAAFFAMMGQIPLINLTDRYLKDHKTLGNVVFWISIVLGQPACVIMYYYYGATA